MGNPPPSDDQCANVFALYKETKNYAEVSRRTGIARTTVQDWCRRAARRGLDGSVPERAPEGFEIKTRTVQYDADGNITGQSVKQGHEPTGPFEIPEHHQIKGVSALVDADGNVTQQWIKTKLGELDPIALAALVRKTFDDWTPPAFREAPPGGCDECLLTVYPLADVHLGLVTSVAESGEDFDLEIATERLRNTSERLFDASPNSHTALILQLGDWTHMDDDLALTPTSKNFLQVGSSLLTAVTAGVALLKDHISRALQKHQNVIVKILKGNHDLNAWIALYVGIQEAFRDNPRVTVDTDEADYWFFRFGSTLIGAHHGHRLKAEEMAGAMATECREDWGETDHRLFLHGHLHHERVKEVLGVRVECMRTLASVDRFHSGKYGSGKTLMSITFHRETGEAGRKFENLPPVKKRASRAGEA